MNKICFYTIITSNYIPYAITVFESLNNHKIDNFKFFCLIFNNNDSNYNIKWLKNKCKFLESKNINIKYDDIKKEKYIGENIFNNNIIKEIKHKLKIYSFKEINLVFVDEYNNQLYKEIIKKYKNIDVMRWSCKPIFGLDLLEYYNKVLYVDNDLYFHNNYKFLIDYLNIYNFVLTPHNREETVKRYDGHYPNLLWRDGFFNAGFFGTNINGRIILLWWIKMLLFRCDNDNCFFHDDQKYLDYIPIKFDNIKIVRHIGCNVSEWNYTCCPRILKNNKLYLEYSNNEKIEIIFCHYTKYFLNFINEKDTKFKELSNLYKNHLNSNKNKL